LESAVRDSPLKISQMVKRMGISRGTYYNHKNDPNLSYEHLAQYGKVLKYDFTQDFPEMRKYTFDEPDAPYGPPATLQEALEQRDYWKDKYYKLMDQFHKTIEKKLDLDKD
jgi:hypothetical protein